MKVFSGEIRRTINCNKECVAELQDRIKTLEAKVSFLESWRSFVLELEGIKRRKEGLILPSELETISFEEWDRRNGL